MKRIILLSAVFLCFALQGNAIRVNFTAFNMSANVAAGTMGVYTFYEIYPDNYVADSTDSTELVDFPLIDYSEVSQIIVEKILLSNLQSQVYTGVTTFDAANSLDAGDYQDLDIVAGEVYVYRLSVLNTANTRFDLLLKTTATEPATPNMSCAKLNNIYRKACHNCFQDNLVKAKHGGLYTALFTTRIIELDLHRSWADTAGKWAVAHTGSTSDNNCGLITPGWALGNQRFGVCLTDVNLWHATYPDHDPIIVYLDIKDVFFDVYNNPWALDNYIKSIIGTANIYKPADLAGSYGDMHEAARRNNWPSMGDLKNKFLFVLTGDAGDLNYYLGERGLDALAFCALSVTHLDDEHDMSGIDAGRKKHIVFYNLRHFSPDFTTSNADMSIAQRTSDSGGINRSWRVNTGFQAGPYTDVEYRDALDHKINNVAVGKNFRDPNHPATYSHGQNGIKHDPVPVMDVPVLVTDHIYSSYANVTQTATQRIEATNLVVEPGAHYRMQAGESITLIDNTDIRLGSDVDIKIDNCELPDFWALNKNAQRLSDDEIDGMVQELSKSLYGNTQAATDKIANLKVYPNPASQVLQVKYSSFTANNALFTLADVMGKTVRSIAYTAEGKGSQLFSVDLGNLPNGVYFYTLQSGNETYNGKVVKVN